VEAVRRGYEHYARTGEPDYSAFDSEIATTGPAERSIPPSTTATPGWERAKLSARSESTLSDR